ncbi:MAG: CubicO group peptidase (beta-lactamase class C family), partial [Myxococcota bacterium]
MQHAAGDASLETVYDLASLTKPMAVGSLLMRAWHQGRVTLDETALGVATVGDLAGHVSGLPAHRHYYESCDSPAAIRRAVLSEPLVAARGTAIYSDLGYMVLGWFLEERLGASLQDLFAGVAAELELSSTQYLPGSSEPVLPKEMIAPTEVIDGQALCGTVHDGNARALGGV